jgi:hypothetical protein
MFREKLPEIIGNVRSYLLSFVTPVTITISAKSIWHWQDGSTTDTFSEITKAKKI